MICHNCHKDLTKEPLYYVEPSNDKYELLNSNPDYVKLEYIDENIINRYCVTCHLLIIVPVKLLGSEH